MTLLFLLAMVAIHGSSQQSNIQFQHLSIDEDLSNSNVSSIVQDSLGFIWIGTEEGLNRYDGYSLKVYKHVPADSHSITGNWISSLCIDPQGILWVGDAHVGLNRYDPVHDRFICYRHNPNDPNSLGSNGVNQVIADRNGDLLVATNAGLDRFDRAENRFIHYRHNPLDSNSLGSISVSRVLRDAHGMIWIGVTRHGINSFDPTSKKFVRYPFGRIDESGTSSNLINWFSEDDHGNIWMAAWESGVDVLDQTTQQFSHFQHDRRDQKSFGDTSATALHRRRAGGMWIGTFNSGLDYYDAATAAFHHFRNDSNDPQSLSTDRVTALCEDRDGRLWAGTQGGGVNVYDPLRKLFKHVRPSQDRTRGLNDNTVWALCEDHTGEVWIGTESGGLNRYNPRTNRFLHYLHDPKNPNSLSSNFVKTICEDRSGKLWVGTPAGVDRLIRDGTFKHYRHDPRNARGLGDDEISVIYQDNDGKLWVATHHGLATYDRDADKFVSYIPPGPNVGNLMEVEIQFIHQDTRGEIWIGTFGDGLFRLNKKTNTLVHYTMPTLPANGMYAIAEDNTGTIWTSTFGRGLSRYDRKANSFTHFSEQDGLPSNFVKAIVCDDRGGLWLSTMRGLSYFDPAKLRFKNFGTDDGIQANEFRTGSCFKTKDGRIYFGGVNGYNVFHPDSIRDNPVPPPVVLTSFKVFDAPFPLNETLANIDHIQLSYSQDVLSFEFVALNYTNAVRNQYAYKMEGFDKEWIQAGTRRYASYTHLDPGEYVFRVKGSNDDGVWNEAGAFVRLVVVPPFWMTWWFRVSAILFVFGTILWTIRSFEMRKVQEKMRRLEQEAALERERTRIARDMHDDLGARLTEIKMLSELTQRNLEDDRTARSNLEEISDRAREVVDSFQEIVWSVNPTYDTLDNFADFLTQYASGYLGKAGVRCRLDIPAFLPKFKVSAEIRHNLMMVVKEALTNTIRHAAASEVNIALTCEDERMSVTIRDDGRGFSMDNVRRFGNGLANMRQRLESIGGTVDIESASGKGTRIKISVTLSESGE